MFAPRWTELLVGISALAWPWALLAHSRVLSHRFGWTRRGKRTVNARTHRCRERAGGVCAGSDLQCGAGADGESLQAGASGNFGIPSLHSFAALCRMQRGTRHSQSRGRCAAQPAAPCVLSFGRVRAASLSVGAGGVVTSGMHACRREERNPKCALEFLESNAAATGRTVDA